MTFLRLFAAHRDLEERLKASERATERLNAQCEELRQQNVLLFTRIDESHKSEIEATRKIADFVGQTRYGRSVFDPVSEIPTPPPNMQPINVGKKQATDLVAEQTAKFWEELRKNEAVMGINQNHQASTAMNTEWGQQ